MVTASNPRPVFKAASALPAEADPYEFQTVASTASVDRYGDVVEQDWNLDEFRSNPVVLFAHDATEIVGTATDIQVKAKRLVARIKLAAEGTSERVNNLRRLAEQRLIRAVSVGFMPGSAKVREDRGQPVGYTYSQNRLMEISIVGIPANPDALVSLRSLDISPEFAARYFTGTDLAAFHSRKRAQIQLARAGARVHSKG